MIAFPRPIAHRGLHDKSAGVIENSRTAFEQAAQAGYAIECDLQLSRDGVPMVFHDQRLDRLTGRAGLVRETLAADLGTYPLTGSAANDCPQTFAAFLDQIGGRVLLQVELKHQTTPEATEALARAAFEIARHYSGPLVFESFDPRLLTVVRRAGYAGPLGIITWRYDEPDDDTGTPNAFRDFALRHLLHWPMTRFDFISCDKTALDLPAIRLFRALGKPVTAWTIRSQVEADAALASSDQLVFEGFAPGH
jgi:glycerophosphoryl diester phosphodiesterase